MKKFFVFLIFSILTLSTFALEIAGVNVDATKNIQGKELVLNGAGIRKKAFLNLYVASLYLNSKTTEWEVIVKESDPVVIDLVIVSNLVGSKEMKEAVDEGFKNSLPADKLSAIQEDISKFTNSFMTEEIKNGDKFEFVANNNSVTAVKNGKSVITIQGKDFKDGLLGIWLGQKPADKNLKEAMISGK